MVAFPSSAEDLYCHAGAGAVTHAGEIEVGMRMCLCLSYLLPLLSGETGLGREIFLICPLTGIIFGEVMMESIRCLLYCYHLLPNRHDSP